MTTKFYVGVSGFSYAGWKGTFYPEDLKTEDFLSYYSKHLMSVEINSSFYAPPRLNVLKNWSDKTGKEFKFSFKAPRKITHISKLGNGSSRDALSFSKSVSSLGSKSGPILFQLPPYMKLDYDRLGGFLSETEDIKERVFEFRNPSWFQNSTFRLLEKEGVSFCVAETDEGKPEVKAVGALAYFRLRRENYSESEIDSWSKTIQEVSEECDESFVYLRHDETGKNALLAKRLAASMG